MTGKPRSFNEEVINYFKYDFRDNLRALRRWARYYWTPLCMAAVFLIGLSAYISYGTASKVVLGYAQAGTIYRDIAESYQKFFTANGLVLELSPVSHLKESVQQLALPGQHLNASFVLSGTKIAEDDADFVTIGTVEYAPGWLFYRGAEIEDTEPFSALNGKRISIGLPGSLANQSFRRLMAAAEVETNAQEFLELSDQEAVQQLLDGQLDAIWIVDSYNASNVRRAAVAAGINIFNWKSADAFVERFPSFKKLLLPAGFFDIGENRPRENLAVLGASVSIIVEANLHPAAQWALILATRDYHENNYDDLGDGTIFPKYTDKDRPLSPVADRYYETGVPDIFSYLPLYYAALWEAKWSWILSVLLLLLVAYYWWRRVHEIIEDFDETKPGPNSPES
jgi:TRAP-type uncharacterized transport system substrate-binding protein